MTLFVRNAMKQAWPVRENFNEVLEIISLTN